MKTDLELVVVDFYVGNSANRVVVRIAGFITEENINGIFLCSCYNTTDITDNSGERYMKSEDILQIIYPNL